ncbi:tetratricopeptide repeat protein, partial [Singulisphaera rosea]
MMNESTAGRSADPGDGVVDLAKDASTLGTQEAAGSPDACFARGQAARRQGKPDRAAEEFGRAVA